MPSGLSITESGISIAPWREKIVDYLKVRRSDRVDLDATVLDGIDWLPDGKTIDVGFLT